MKENKTSTELSYDDLPELVDIVGISFRTAGKIYYFASAGIVCKEGEHAIVETARGAEYGIVAIANHLVPKKDLILPLRTVVRVATPDDDRRFEANARQEEEAFSIAVQKIAEHKLAMKLVDVEYTFDNSKLLFYFTADDRVDFRDLVKDLAAVFRTRIELRQIGIRDEAKMMGGLGICGREFCCHSFLGDFAQVTIKMAKEQNLSLNAAKISGACGKLMCCLRYEHESYQQEIALTPKVGSSVTTPDGAGVVVSNDPLRGTCTVRLDKTTDDSVTTYHRDLLNRPENPTVTPPVIAPRITERNQRQSSSDRVAKTETAPRAERSEHPSHSLQAANDGSDKATHDESAKSHPLNDHPDHERRGDRSARHGNRPEKRNKTDHKDHKADDTHSVQKSDHKQQERKASGKHPEQQQTSQRGGVERRERPAPKNNRPAPSEKKSESKFDVKFGGGQMPTDPRSSGEGKVDHSGRGGRHRNKSRRGDRKGEKKSENKE